MKIKIFTDSCCDLPLEFVEANEDILEVLGMPIQINGVEVIDDLGKTFDRSEFYNKLRQGTMPTTSQINAYRFDESFRQALAEGNEIVYIGFTSGMSGTFNSASIAKQMILDDMENAKINLLDTLSASIGQGTLVVEAVKMVRAGKSIDEISNWVESNKLKTHHWFGVDDLNYLKNGGRISHVSAMVGSVLNVKPTLGVGHDGKLKPYGNVRGRKKSIAQLANKFESHYCQLSASTVIVGHGNCPEDAEQLRNLLISKSPNLDILVSELSMTIASHVGPNMIAVAFIGDEREA
ncbi:MAG TPA: fatty acid-binding protein DegV [Clostridiales bacterium UBA8960]|jgi:DegV family protein with EDD domain|nr:fatty acid-binding protein DegV [Clostridiales bacterium UBA8960]